MNIILAYQKVEIYVEHNSSIGDKNMLHVVVLLRFVLVPNEVADKPFHNVSISAQFFQKVALAVEHVLIFQVGTTVFTLDCCLVPLKSDKTLYSLAFTVSFRYF